MFPRVEVVRNIRDDGANYFGPYHSATSRARDAAHAQPPLPAAHVHRSRARDARPAVPAVPDQALLGPVRDRRAARGVRRAGRGREAVPRRQERRARARACARAWQARAEREDFEVAAALRDSIAAVERTLAKQHIVQDDFVDQDVWGLYREADIVEVVVLFVRAGKLVGRRAFQQKDQELPDAAVIAEYVQQYYATGTFIPDEIVVGVELEDAERARRVARRARAASASSSSSRSAACARGSSSSPIATRRRSAASRRGRDADAEALLAKVADRLGLRAAAAPHRVLRHRAHPGHRDGRVDGDVRRRRAGARPVSQVQGALGRRTTTSRRCTRC